MTVENATESLAKMAGLVQTFRQLDPEIPAQTVLCFLTVAQSMPEGILLHELGKKLGLSQAAAQRNSMFLSKYKGLGLPGHDLINVEIVPEDRRQRRLTLTSKGEKFIAKCLKYVD